jgi:predicted lactoylglutathione lyase
MSRQIFLNLPVSDLSKSMAFYQALGFSNNPQMSGGDAACIVISDAIFVMLATHEKFREFTPKAVCDTSKAVEVLIRALAAGGSTYDKPEDLGFMYSHSFLDLDGHGWGLFHMSAMPGQE